MVVCAISFIWDAKYSRGKRFESSKSSYLFKATNKSSRCKCSSLSRICSHTSRNFLLHYFFKEPKIPSFTASGQVFDVYSVGNLEGGFDSFIDMVVDQLSASHFALRFPIHVHMGNIDVSREQRIKKYFLALQARVHK